MAKCPTCGQEVVAQSAKQLVASMKAHRNGAIYPGQDGGFYIEYGGGRVDPAAIREAFKAGLIKKRWPERPDLASYILA